MDRRIVLLRAVNVGGATLPMADLRAIATELGAGDVSTHIASGNLICRPPGDPAQFDTALEAAIADRFGFVREAISRTASQLRAALDAHPFEVLDARFSYVSFCRTTPGPDAVARARRFETGDDLWSVIGADLHIRYAHGAGRARMPTTSILRALGTPSTARNLRTVRTLIELAS